MKMSARATERLRMCNKILNIMVISLLEQARVFNLENVMTIPDPITFIPRSWICYRDVNSLT